MTIKQLTPRVKEPVKVIRIPADAKRGDFITVDEPHRVIPAAIAERDYLEANGTSIRKVKKTGITQAPLHIIDQEKAKILGVLRAASQGMTYKSLARAADLPYKTLSNRIAQLIAKGYVSRTGRPRGFIARITPTGEKWLDTRKKTLEDK